MRKKIIEGKNIEEVKNKAIEIFKVPEEKLIIDVTNEKKGFFGIGSSITASVSLNVNPTEEGLKYLKEVIKEMGIDAKIEMITNKNQVKYNIYSDNNPLLIGREGSTIDALQFVTRHVISRYSDERIISVVDVGGYKQKRKMQLEIIATKVAKEVARTKIEVKLDPMNSYERRIIHTKLSEWRDVYTESVGEEPHRSLIIKPKRR
ncbi:KH domain-containing protein [Mycoplasmatota bacterium]|nr:KH domain-containing protein [Mycoplasmatota bacterium]